jgi:nitrile hydratase accessory protein
LQRHDADRLPGLPQNEAGPVFAAPWQAEAFAMTLALCEKGFFSWPEWAETLGEEIRTHPVLDDGLHYYHLWLAALHKLLIRKGLMTDKECRSREHEWHRASLATPHGEPIVISRALRDSETAPKTSRTASGSSR